MESAYPLPDPGGHELTAVPGTPLLAVTTGRSGWFFHCETRTFAPHPELRGREGLKSISIHPRTGQIAYVQADRRSGG